MAKAFNAMADSVKERTAKLRSIIDTAVDAIIVLSSKGIVQEFSPAAEKIFGYGAREIIGENISLIMPEPTRSAHDRYIARYLKTGKARILGAPLEITGLRKNGEHFPISISISEARVGEEILFTGIIRDISKQKEAEKELQKLSSAVEQSPVSVIITDRAGNIEYVNKTFTAATGYSYDEAIGENLRILRSGNLGGEQYADLWDTILAGKTWTGDMVSKTKYGREFWERAAIAPLFGENNEISHFVLVKEDITQQKKLEKEIQESEALHRLLAESSADMIIQYDPEGKASYVSPACRALSGFEPNDLIGRTMPEMVHPDDRQQVREELSNLKNPDAMSSQQVRLLGKEGGACWVHTVSRPIVDQETGEIKGTMSVSRDIGEQKMMEDARKISLQLSQMPDAAAVEEIMERGLEESIALTESSIGYFHLMDQQQHTVGLPVWSQKAKEQCSTDLSNAHYPLENAGVWADSYRQKKTVIHNAFSASPGPENLPEGHIELTRHMSVPVFEDDEVAAILGVGNKKHPYLQQDADILSMLADNIWSVVRRKRIAETILQNERRLKLVLKSGNLGYWDTDLEKREMIVNERWAEMFGFQHGELKNAYQAWKASLHPEDRKRVLETGRDYILGKIPSYDVEHRVLTKQKEVRWVLSRGTVVERDKSNQPKRMVGTILDVSEQKNIEQELRQNMEDLQRFTKIAVGREERMIELKDEINGLLSKLGRAGKYTIR